MHIISTKKDDRDGTYRSTCSEGDFVSNAYGTKAVAETIGLRHKEVVDGDTNDGHKDLGKKKK